MSADPPPLPLVIRSSRGKLLLLLLAALAFVAGGLFILAHGRPGEAWVGWAGIVFFGACAAVFVRQLLDARPRLVIDDIGILDRTLGVGLIPWQDIAGAYLRSLQGNHFICLELRDPAPWLAKLSAVQRAMTAANEALGFTPLSLNLAGVAADPRQVLELILKVLVSRDSA